MAAPGPRSVGARRGVSLFGDVTIVSVHSSAGEARAGAASADGSSLAQAIAVKRRKYGDVMSSHVADLVVLGCEVYGRWSPEAVDLVQELVALKAQEAPPSMRGCAKAAWSQRWWAVISVGVQRAIAEALLSPANGIDLQPCPAAEPVPPLAEVLAQA